ncbi:MAG: oligoribonuclease [Candidatus Eutrophobiaceae bacterium]
MISPENLIWIDLEMTGLNPERDRIIEISTVITNSKLDILAEGPALAIQTSEEILSNMDEWNTVQHNKSGLVKRIREAGVGLREAELRTLTFLQKYVPRKCSPMCGNSICQDRRFMARLMSDLESYFHYRHIDVSTIKELVQRWAPLSQGFDKGAQHRALQDVRDSISELKHYRDRYFHIPHI